MNEKIAKINHLLVEVYDDVGNIEEHAVKQGAFSDLSIKEIHTIEAIGMYGSKIMSELAQTMKLTMGTLTIAVDKLIKKGYVERKRGETDRRIVMVSLTKRGKLAYRVHEKFHLDMVKTMLDGMTDDEEEILLTALDKLNGYLKQVQ